MHRWWVCECVCARVFVCVRESVCIICTDLAAQLVEQVAEVERDGAWLMCSNLLNRLRAEGKVFDIRPRCSQVTMSSAQGHQRGGFKHRQM